ncbi:MAG: 4'-phosphopantetheinyl transferase superfamily protein [Bacilli bacterium]|nr:4'-phosphopantetheinyl transferase superfamily protein [Bacilli bacterium]
MIGIDMLNVNKINIKDEIFIKHFFTKNEIAESFKHYNRQIYLAERFAIKEAAFKALNNIIIEYDDLRLIETLSTNNIPRARFIGKLEKYNDSFDLLVSLSNEDNYVITALLANKKTGM